ncbi:MAG TPA: Trm112 family protein [Gemmatimonadales bacterium]|nr:Trm112 family protein [Gemmatimonadales bacterium]
MFIELTDHLRCPADHVEAHLVLLPHRVEARAVIEGQLGCPVCGRTFPIVEGVAELGGRPVRRAGEPLPADTAHVLLGLGGPGGYAVLAGSAAVPWRELAELNPGVALVAVNPPIGVADAAPVLSVLRAPMLPLRARSMRGVVLGAELAGDERWVREAARVTLPGLRVVARGPDPAVSELELLASAGGCWVAARRA